MCYRSILVYLILAGSALLAKPIPSGIFADHMVLQRDYPVIIWGNADPGEKVYVSLDQEKAMAVSDEHGFWNCELPAQPASTSPKTLKITGDRMPSPVIFNDILIGDVWLCAGQSNMTLYIKYLTNYPGVSEDISTANFPLIRQGAVARQPSITPQLNCSVSWRVCSPDTVGVFSAAGFYFARDLQKDLGVPIGVLLSSFGSTRTEEWISREALEHDPICRTRFEQQQELYRKEISAEMASKTWSGILKGKIRAWLFKETPPNPSKILNKTASAHYNGMIYPLASFPIKGVIWYQGEEEALENRIGDYGRQLPLLISDWRKIWKRPQMPFLIQQLPEFKGEGVDKTEWAELREVQSRVVEKSTESYLICGFGAGETNGLHPANKREIGRRWALATLSQVYATKIPAEGPSFASATVQDGCVRVLFKNSKGLRTTDGKSPHGFFIAGEDRVFVPAEARIDGDAVVLTSERVAHPTAVRYAFQNAPAGLNLTNDSGFPAFPFRTDHSP